MWPPEIYEYQEHLNKNQALVKHSPEMRKFFLERCAMIAKDYTNWFFTNYWIEADEDGFTGWRWVKYKKKPRLVCAANRYKDLIILGTRHYSPTMHISVDAFGGVDILYEYADGDHEQGFVDQYGRFWSREEAKIHAMENGQLIHPENCPSKDLFSEGLY